MKTSLRDDSAAANGSNGKPALAGVIRSSVKIMNDFKARPRAVRHWIGGNDNYAETTANPTLRHMHLPGVDGSTSLAFAHLSVPVANVALAPLTGLHTYYGFDGVQVTDDTWAQHQIKENLNDLPAQWYPDRCALSGRWVTNPTYNAAKTAVEVTARTGTSGSVDGPQLRAGMLYTYDWAAARTPPLYGKTALPIDELTTGHDVIGAGLSDYRDMVAFRDFLRKLQRDKRIELGWSAIANSVTPWISFTGAAQYFHDKDYGAGGTKTPTYNGPGIDLTVTYAAQGRRTSIRVYPRFYARMAGGGSGSFSVYTRDATAGTGGMTGPTALTNPVTVTGSTWRWWPNTATFSESADPYFLANADPAKIPHCDNILPCGVASGGELQVAAYTLCVRPSTL
jgi:hypothetical protein